MFHSIIFHFVAFPGHPDDGDPRFCRYDVNNQFFQFPSLNNTKSSTDLSNTMPGRGPEPEHLVTPSRKSPDDVPGYVFVPTNRPHRTSCRTVLMLFCLSIFMCVCPRRGLPPAFGLRCSRSAFCSASSASASSCTSCPDSPRSSGGWLIITVINFCASNS